MAGEGRALADAAQPLLAVENLRVEFPTRRGTLVAVHDVSFTIAPGEVLGVVGESGAGKSLTGAAIIGLIDPPGRIAAGRILLAGRRIDALPYEEMRRIRGREIGAIFQDPLTSLNPLYTIGRQLIETIRTHLDRQRVARRAPRAVALLEEVGIPAAARRIDHYPHQFSGGMRQRVVIALALAANPKLIVADEPTTALDVSIQAQIIQLLKRLCRDHGTAVMLVTHDMGVIAETADRVAVMYAGRIVEIGLVAEVINRPQHPYTVGLMGSIPKILDERARLTQIDGSMPRLTAVPPGCAFHPRCPHAFGRCMRQRPELMDAGASRAACWLHDPVARLEAMTEETLPGIVAASGRSAALGADAPERAAPCRCREDAIDSDVLLEVDGVARYFDVSPPWLNRVIERKPRVLLKAVDGVRPRDPPRRDARPRRRIRLRQVDGRARHRRPVRADARHDPLRRRGPRRRGRAAHRRGTRATRQAQHADDLPGPVREPESALARRGHRGRADARAGRRARAKRRRSARRRHCSPRSAWHPSTAASIRTSSPADSASASRSRARWRPIPAFLVCDEPTSALDVSVQAQVLNLMRDLQRSLSLTYLFISHNLAVVRHIADRVGVMYLGRIVELAPTRRLFALPQHPYTRMLLEAVPDISMTGKSRTAVAGEVPNPLDPPPGCPFHPRCPYANERCRSEVPKLLPVVAGGEAACHGVEEGRIPIAEIAAA